jgi:DNA replication protein DnaC
VVHERDGVTAAERCACVAVSRVAGALDSAQIPPLYGQASFENFVLPKDNPIHNAAMAKVMVEVRGFAREFPGAGRPGLLFIGDPGVGKTHLAVATLRALIAKGFSGLFFDYQNLLDRIRSGYSELSGASDREAYRNVLDAEILLLDDLGAHRVTDWVEDTVTSIITWRCNHRKPTIFTTNLADADAGTDVLERGTAPGSKTTYKTTLSERIGSRARSRIFEMCRVIRMPLIEDYRIRTSQRR